MRYLRGNHYECTWHLFSGGRLGWLDTFWAWTDPGSCNISHTHIGLEQIYIQCYTVSVLSGTQDGAKRGWSSARDSGSDVTTTAYKGRGALSTEAVVPKPQSDHRRHIATDGRRRQVLVRLEMLHHYHSNHPDSHTPARYPPLGLIQIRPNACTVILKLILFQNIVEPTRIWNKA